MRLPATLISMLAAAAAPAAPQAAPPAPNAVLHGIWRNPRGTVDVRIEDCGQQLCGTVTGAAAEAINDARDSGYPNLVGMRLMRDYRPAGAGHWVGTVFVPDLGHSFSSHIDLVDAAHARIAGCLWHQYFCKSQVWRRL